MELKGKDLIRAISNESDTYQYIVEKVLDGINRLLIKQLSEGNIVKFSGLGEFEKIEQKEKRIISIDTGKPIIVKPNPKIKFTPLPSFRKGVTKESV